MSTQVTIFMLQTDAACALLARIGKLKSHLQGQEQVFTHSTLLCIFCVEVRMLLCNLPCTVHLELVRWISCPGRRSLSS